MNTYKNLQEEFNNKVNNLRKNCKHPKISGWMDYYWAPGHTSAFQVKICEVCEKTVNSRTVCHSCHKTVEEKDLIKGDGKATPLGSYFCSERCRDVYARKNSSLVELEKRVNCQALKNADKFLEGKE